MYGVGALSFYIVVHVIFLGLSIFDFVSPVRPFLPILIYLVGWFFAPLVAWISFVVAVRNDLSVPQTQYSKYKWDVHWWLFGIIGWFALMIFSSVYFIVHGTSSSPSFAAPLTDVEMRDYTLLNLWMIITTFFSTIAAFAALWEKIFDSNCLVRLTGAKWKKMISLETLTRSVE